MEDPGSTRPRVTFFPPPESRELNRACCMDSDMEVGGHVLHGSLPRSDGRSSHHALLLLEKKAKHFEEAKKKTKHYHKQLKQQFVKEQERKMARWKKASERFEKSLEVLSRKGGKSSGGAAGQGGLGKRT